MTAATNPARLRSKRVLDVGSSLLGLLALAPVMTCIALAIRLDSPGPAIFRQKRIGRGMEHFEILKFRTMHVDTPDLPTDEVLKRPSPVTRVGQFLRRTSLDELPQLLNVLLGEMSLVGPRPALYNQTELNAAREAEGVHQLLPGITGWAQVNGRDELEIAEKVAYDRWYLDHASLGLDLQILAMTIRAVFSKRGAY